MSQSEVITHEAFEALWTPQDAANYLRCSVSLIYKLAERDALPCLRFARLLRFDPATVRAFAKGEVPTADVVELKAPGRSRRE